MMLPPRRAMAPLIETPAVVPDLAAQTVSAT
jgi:hypothetical protein